MILRGTNKWNKECQILLCEIEAFLRNWDRQPAADTWQYAGIGE
jgi:hypothetical protein